MKKRYDIKVYAGIFIVAIMVLSVFGFILAYKNEDEQTFEYNGFKFHATNQGLYTKINNKKLLFYFEPEQLANINVSPQIKNIILNAKVIALTYTPESKYKQILGSIQYEMANTLYDLLGIIPQRGLTDNKGYQLDKISCQNATQFVPVVYFKESVEEGYDIKNNCIIISAKDENGFLRLYNRLLYSLFGVIK